MVENMKNLCLTNIDDKYIDRPWALDGDTKYRSVSESKKIHAKSKKKCDFKKNYLKSNTSVNTSDLIQNRLTIQNPNHLIT